MRSPVRFAAALQRVKEYPSCEPCARRANWRKATLGSAPTREVGEWKARRARPWQSGSGAPARLEQSSRPLAGTFVAGHSILGSASAAVGDMLADLRRSETDLRRFLHGLPGVDQVGAEMRAASLATRSIKTSAKLWALEMAVSMVDLTTLEGADTPGKVLSLCAKARRPDPADASVPPVAAVCIYPDLVPIAKRALMGTSVKVASVATAFPSGRASLAVKLADVRDAVTAGADEVDMVIDRGAFLAGRYGLVLEEVQAVKEACGQAHLKVILETGELVTYDNVRRAVIWPWLVAPTSSRHRPGR